MKTKLSALIQENNELEERLLPEDDEALGQIMKYFFLSPISSMDAQVLRKDLLGMAQEARQRGERLQDMIGDDIKVFCESVLENIQKDKTECRLHRLSTGLRYVLIIYLVDWGFINSLPKTHGIIVGWVLIIPVALVCALFTNKYFEKKFIFSRNKIKYMWAVGSMMLLIAYGVIINVSFSDTFLRTELFFVPGWITAVILALATTISYLVLWGNRNRKDLKNLELK